MLVDHKLVVTRKQVRHMDLVVVSFVPMELVVLLDFPCKLVTVRKLVGHMDSDHPSGVIVVHHHIPKVTDFPLCIFFECQDRSLRL